MLELGKNMNILVIGSGGREHALVWKLRQSTRVDGVFIAPGNPGTAQLGENISIDVADHHAVIACAKKHHIDLVVVGPDDALASGIVNSLQNAGIDAFGPTKEAAEIEWSKSFAKDLLKRLAIPTAEYQTFTDIRKAKEYVQGRACPLVVKASGLALGKGVVIAGTHEEAERALEDMLVRRSFGKAGETVIVEDLLQGEEISVHAFCDGETAVLFPSAQDHKRVFDDDKGPNTGGMGTVAPVPSVSEEIMNQIEREIVRPVLLELKNIGRPYKGILFPGIMLTRQGPKVLEFNARFGDPETQSYLRILKSDLVDILLACSDGGLRASTIEWEDRAACCVVLASSGYPKTYPTGMAITGIEDAEHIPDVVVFQAGTKFANERLVTNGGRVLGVSATGATLEDARMKAYAAAEIIKFDGKHFRKDIA